MDREFYEQMADGFTAQLKDILAGATYDQMDELMDIIEQMMMNTESEEPSERLKTLILSIYSSRLDDISVDGDISLEGLNLSSHSVKQDDDSENYETGTLSMDDFVFSL